MQRKRWRDRGHAVVELAVVLPVLLLIAGGVIDGGWLWYQAQSVAHAAGAGARRGGLLATGMGECSGSPSPAVRGAVERAVREAAPSLDARRLAVAVEYTEPSCVGRMRTLKVVVTYTLQTLTPALGRLAGGTQHRGATALVVEMIPPEWVRAAPPGWWGASPPAWWGASAPAWWGQSPPSWWGAPTPVWWGQSPPAWWGARPPAWWGQPPPPWWGQSPPPWWGQSPPARQDPDPGGDR